MERNKKNDGVVREKAYAEAMKVNLEGFRQVGRVAGGGLVFQNEDGVYVEMKLVVKNADFDGEFEVEDFKRVQEERAKAEADKKAKGAKDKAKKDKAKAEAEEKAKAEEKGE